MPHPRRAVAYRSTPPARSLELEGLSEAALLRTRLCDLPVRLRGSELEARASVLVEELAYHGLVFRPHMWLSTEWFSPDDVPGIAIPFYLAHPRLRALEAQQMGEVEGGTPRAFMELMRHEAGHALDSAYRLHERPDWEAVFGSFDAPYHSHYETRPHSRRFVRHLGRDYAQSHPAEDFAETVAVWLDPESRWRTRYRGWPAMEKLLYVNRVLREIAQQPPLVRRREQVDPISAVTLTLRAYYERKRRRYHLGRRATYERDLKRLFRAPRPGHADLKAAAFLQRARPEIRKLVADATGAFQYDIERLLGEMIERSAELDLVASNGAVQSERRTTQRVAAQLARYLAQGHHRHVR